MQHSAMGRYVRNALEEQVQRNATQQCSTKDIFKLKPKCNTMQRNTTVQEEDMWEMPQRKSTMQQSNTKDILELKPKCNAMQHNSAMGRYVRNALEEQVQCNATQRNATVQH